MIAGWLLTRKLRGLRSQQLTLEPHRPGALPRPAQGAELLLYAHVPFCELLCPYCSFNRFPYREDAAHRYFRSLREEMRILADRGYRFSSMYIGGGTPTVDVGELVATIDLARDLFDVGEVSTETNPNHLNDAVLGPLEGRVQRLSVGVQSLNDDLLRQMKRHDKYGSAAQILAGLDAARGRLPTLNVDMIFNLPSLTDEILQRDMELLVDADPDQITYYPLMVSPSVARPLERALGRVDDRREARQYRLISRTLAGRYAPASAWAFSRVASSSEAPSLIDEYIVDHAEYVGVGSGSFSYLGGEIYANTFSLRSYQEAIEEGRLSVDARMPLSRRDRRRYRMMIDLFGLRLDKRAFARDHGAPVERALWLEYAFLKAAGAFARDDGDALELTETGRYLLVVMMREFFIGVNGIRDLARATLPEAERALFEQEPACSRPIAVPQAVPGFD
ncbi:MAG: coproporphyrinogen III oxidase family protein [Trueperaceae bacterium]|nr:coproporphyrinogen III oxidase family protein [Trueperaceae bacterium]